jgi:hypothetical protein
MKKWIIGFLLAFPMFIFSPTYAMSPYYALFPCFDVELYKEMVATEVYYNKVRAERLAREAKLAQRK